MIVDPRMLESSLAVIRAELEMAKASLLPLTGHTRKWVEFERLKLEALQQRAALAAAQVKLRYAEAQFVRMDQLFQSGGTNVTNVVSQQMYEIAARDRDTLRAEIASQTNMITGLERSLAGFEAAELHAEASSDEPELRAALRLQEERLKQAEAEMRPLTLRAPISGMVSLVYRRAGENIPAGEPLALIVGPADRIIGYVTQPTRFEPRVGMKVRVSSRAPGRPGGFGTIREVGADVQRMPTNLLLSLSVSGRAVELGIPVLVSLPTGLSLRPGEVVDLQCERGPVAMP
jgi:multidrug resistance efflux pump